MTNTYLFFKLLHFISLISWMVGLFYLPRLFVYHSESKIGTDKYNTFSVMERKLIKIIMTPAMVFTWITGLTLILIVGVDDHNLWLVLKIFLVFLLSGFHGFLSVCQKKFSNNFNNYSSRFYRIINEVPTLFLILILFLVVFKPSL